MYGSKTMEIAMPMSVFSSIRSSLSDSTLRFIGALMGSSAINMHGVSQNLIYRLIKVVEYENRTSLRRINFIPFHCPPSSKPQTLVNWANEDVLGYTFRSICMQLQHIALNARAVSIHASTSPASALLLRITARPTPPLLHPHHQSHHSACVQLCRKWL